MSGRAFLRQFCRDQAGSAAEFALLLPVAMLLFFGIIDAGRYAYTFNMGEKATQTGVRWAIVTDPIAPELTTASYLGQTVGSVELQQGDRIPEDALDPIVCAVDGCTCQGTCPTGIGVPDSAALARLVGRMQDIWPQIADANVVVEYDGAGLGYPGNPNGMDIAPFVTVRLTGMQFTSILLFGSTIGFPDFSYTLTMEDGLGTSAN